MTIKLTAGKSKPSVFDGCGDRFAVVHFTALEGDSIEFEEEYPYTYPDTPEIQSSTVYCQSHPICSITYFGDRGSCKLTMLAKNHDFLESDLSISFTLSRDPEIHAAS